MRLHTDETHSFEGVKKAAYEETHPLAVTVAENASGAVFVGYALLSPLHRRDRDELHLYAVHVRREGRYAAAGFPHDERALLGA